MDNTTHNSLVVFLLLTFGVSSIFWARSFSGAPLAEVVPPLMWTPAAAALITQLIFHRTLTGLGWRPGRGHYWIVGALTPIAYCLAVYVPVWLTGLGQFDGRVPARVMPVLPMALATNLFMALGEEIGWRGFLMPAFYRAGGFAWAGLATGILWGLWHVPLIVGGGYDAGTPPWYGIACFMISVPSMSVMMAWLRLRSGSVWPAVLFHGIHNLAIQGIFDGATIDTGATKWITTEFGIGLAVVSPVIGLYFWRRRGEVRDRVPSLSAI